MSANLLIIAFSIFLFKHIFKSFYEWKANKDGKQPYFFHVPQRDGFSFSDFIKDYTTTTSVEKCTDFECSGAKKAKLETPIQPNFDNKMESTIKKESTLRDEGQVNVEVLEKSSGKESCIKRDSDSKKETNEKKHQIHNEI